MNKTDDYLQIINHSPIPTFWKNSERYFMGCNQKFLDMVEVEDVASLIEKLDIDLPWARNWELFEKDDRQVLETGQTVSRLEQIPSGEGGVVWSETIKHPIIRDGKIVGLVGFCKDVTIERRLQEIERERSIDKLHLKLADLVDKFMNEAQHTKLSIVDQRLGISHKGNKINRQQISLSCREQEIIYYLSIYKSPKEIARILSIIHDKDISVRAVQTAISDRLYVKFDVNTTSQLLERAAAYGLIPLRMPS
ncbi:PAS domain-containing protein [Chromobacterium violaceum]|uniref:PAS domain-containing protein n=1 Tax=Chromobacterium violaceum TaxID=536 RepID=UPI0009EF8FB7|nr:PAS domain-containing protein [Chromobacterium violaceum]OQS46281.1 hypothetical protein B0T48_16175 [Chromobacterium violaceum]OQS48724.1 hypothetical protein B0T49_14960 [Chromobacterium violaceum]QRO32262.1 PAS domain-containing protein [Chromobacterium violaceum]QRQ17937.1 PAS domain-containing protein [Chromobacterium violaceum]